MTGKGPESPDGLAGLLRPIDVGQAVKDYGEGACCRAQSVTPGARESEREEKAHT